MGSHIVQLALNYTTKTSMSWIEEFQACTSPADLCGAEVENEGFVFAKQTPD